MPYSDPSAFDESLVLFRDSVRRFLEAEFVPHLDAWRQARRIPMEFFRKAGAQGLLCPTVPAEYGGAECDYRYNAVVIEEVSACGVIPAGFGVHSDIVAHYLLHLGTPEQKARYLPAMVAGELLGAIAMTEPGSGSDLQAIQTTARRDGADYVLNGQKTFITNGQNADLVIVAAKTDQAAGARGISLFLVEAGTLGFARGRQLHKMGGHEQDTSELFFSDLRAPASALLGPEGGGFAAMMSELPTERLSVSIGAVAAAEKALAITIDYVKTREAFGKRLIEFQNTGFKLAELRAEVHAVRAYVNHCLARHLVGAFTAVDGAEAKLVTTKLQCRVVDECLQLHGGNGWMDEYLISRMYADARVQRIYGGTDEIMKLIISRSL